jgi:hypothetical protein
VDDRSIANPLTEARHLWSFQAPGDASAPENLINALFCSSRVRPSV